MFVGDFSSKLESFGCAHRNPSGPMLKNIQKQLNLIYLNNDEHTHTVFIRFSAPGRLPKSEALRGGGAKPRWGTNLRGGA